MTTNFTRIECLLGGLALIVLAALVGCAVGPNIVASVQHVLTHAFAQANVSN